MLGNTENRESTHPILILIDPDSPDRFGSYTGEILKAEGFNSFQVRHPHEITLELLNQHDIVVLTECELTTSQAAILRAYINEGGRLIAFRPEKKIKDIFGISDSGCVVEDGYLRLEPGTPVQEGLTLETMQIHGVADGCTLTATGASSLATLFSDSATPTLYPAVVSHTYGKGKTVAFAYNLPRNIVFTRQGNPAWACQERDGILGIRAAEMYLGWVDTSKNHFNQADMQMQLLSHLIEELTQDRKPLARLWYFPSYNKCLVTLTDDGEDSVLEDFQVHLADIESKGARITVYLKNPCLPVSSVANWVANGHEIACHFDDTAEATQPTYEGMNSVASETVKAHLQAYGYPPRTVRNHWIVWVGWTEQAAIEAGVGIGMDCNLYHYDQGSTHGHYLGGVGNFTGSGLPMKFVSKDGRVIDIYQSLTQLPDEQWLEENFYGCFKTLLDRSLDFETYTFVNVNFHTDRWQVWSRKPGLDMLDYANRRGVPMWTAEHTLNFLKARDSASFHDIYWSDQILSFTFEAPFADQGLTFMLPLDYNFLNLWKVEMDGVRQTFRRMIIKGRAYALAETGSGGSFQIMAYYR
ncbi:MAG: hypothetical protein ABSE06_17305 [Anaerolineaceae bacterium]